MLEYSIVIPVYNVEKYLPYCIDSVLAQCASAMYEVILVDDGSVDQSPQICDRYAERESRIKVVHQANQGVSAARNAGLAAAQGQYVLFLDSDDLWENNLLDVVTEALKPKPDMAVFGYRQFGGKGPMVEAVPEGTEHEETGIAYFKRYELRGVMPIANCCTAAFRRQFFLENDLRFPANVGYGEDFIFHLHCLNAASKVVSIPQMLYRYRVNEASITHTPTLKKTRDVLSACADMYRLFPCAMLADYYCMNILKLADFSREDAMQLYGFLRENNDILQAVSAKKQRLARLLYKIFGWYHAARLVRLLIDIRHSVKG